MTFQSLRNARLIFVGASLTFAAPIGRSALAQTGTACTCADVYDLINRLNMAEAARAALLEELPKVEAADRRDKSTSHLNDVNSNGVTNQGILRVAITRGMASVQMPGASMGAARTDERCRPAVTGSTTACLSEIVMWHEEKVHVPACTDGPKSAIGFRAPQTTVDYIKEEIAGYESEIQRIKEVLKMLPASCRPSGWIGSIQYQEERTMQGETTLPATATRVSGSEQTLQTMVRTAKVWYRESNAPTTVAAAAASPRASTEVNDTFTKRYTVTSRRSCTGGFATPRFDGTMTSTSEEGFTITGTGEKDIDVGFSYDPQNGSYSLSFVLPDAAGTGTQTKGETVSGGCPGADGTKSSSSQISMPYNGERVSVSGTVTQRSTTDVIQGNDTIDFGPKVTMPNLTITHTGTVHWTFYRLP